MPEVKETSLARKAQASHATELGGRYYQEDRQVTISMTEGFIAAVFDGHGGGHVSELLASELATVFSAQLELEHTPESLLKYVVANLDLMAADITCGSTLSLAYLPTDASEVWLAVVGDSPILVKAADGTIVVSPEHNARTNLPEREAAIARGAVYGGGYLWNQMGSYRDDSEGIQMSRALGDKRLRSMLSQVPEIMSVPIDQESWIAVMTDGVVDPGHSDSERMKMIISMLEDGCTASDLVEKAKADKTGDNATAVVVRFSHGSGGESS
jgi:serine/threonine protein phosphatase PrpC